MTASTAHSLAFSPEEAQRIVGRLQQPAVFINMTHGWPVLNWTAKNLCERLGDRNIRFRLGRKEETNEPQFETQCRYVEATMRHFLRWVNGETGDDLGSFSEYPCSQFWAYADYKYIARMFAHQPDVFEEVKWEAFGFEGRNGKDSTLWIGTEGANTPCHMDSYGFNLVLQVEGRKRWHLFPPEDTSKLYPSRIPYEESSVFSHVNVSRPDLARFPAFRHAAAHVVTLLPGQVLYVPRHWWHFVESVDTITVSVNTWIELDEDHVARVGEAVTRTLLFALKTAQGDDRVESWLNPTEEGVTSHNDNIHYINLALRACAQQQMTKPKSDSKDTAHPKKRDSVGQIRSNVPFGPCLLPVPRVPGPFQDGDVAHRTPDESSLGTDDLLDCLLHPNVVTMVTQLLLDKTTYSPRE
ncbi:HSPB1-associated protein 1 homolog isoform X2 [Corythoichthys intestinalis]|nr:HSPB1-associated protein 1 homolog isoform X2 [Corythoichthys intestinalis]XP_057707741.1 HSPB1-associated protein 1 homolog isoform X2 [Corythoichthys intestinalis]XP_057707742.1 HSPB1-associated protein 1 homolog isoform X2 [Corythoichthys intestinalis]XP_057707743.1 HSPB1-associated protein 1 homolog isoform X2 [Corythoichthys intestinalis]XP_061799508.1 HSPB1-associated protein 1 homolog [Nerophis lumbriciformis]